MKLPGDVLARDLERLLGAGTVTADPTTLHGYSIDGQDPALVCVPSSAEEVAAVLRLCAEADAAVMPWGGGTAVHVGNPPRRFDVALVLARLNRLIEHDDANLTATIEAGMTLSAVQETVSRRKQFLPFDAPAPARATVGGVIAANLNGPRRSCYGSVRDLMIGIKAVLATGEQIKAGGKVVKNVAGYDLGKLFVGSMGTLGIITEATVRMAPVPVMARTIMFSGTLAQVLQLADEVARSPLLPSALVIVNSRAFGGDTGPDRFRLALWTEGFEETVARHLHDTDILGAQHGVASEVLENEAHVRLWERVRDFPLAASRWTARVTVPRRSWATVVSTIMQWETADFTPAIVSDAACSVLWIAAASDNPTAEHFLKINSLARAHDGHAILVSAPAELKVDIDVWGGSPPALELMREIKRQLDPRGLLNPGRFVGGI